MINAFLLILSVQLLGSVATRLTGVPIPGTVLGFVMLFFLLMARRDLFSALQPTARTLLDNLALLFLPAAVGIIQHVSLLAHQGWKFLLVLLFSQGLAMAATAATMGAILARQRRRPRQATCQESCHAV